MVKVNPRHKGIRTQSQETIFIEFPEKNLTFKDALLLIILKI